MCPADEPGAEPEGAAPYILIVEDEALLRLALGDHLRDCGYTVLEAATGEEAQAIIRAGAHVDFVISDITMPGSVDGLALARWLREEGVDAPVVLTSGAVSALSAADMACGQITDIVGKPYDYDALTARVRSFIAARDANR